MATHPARFPPARSVGDLQGAGGSRRPEAAVPPLPIATSSNGQGDAGQLGLHERPRERYCALSASDVIA